MNQKFQHSLRAARWFLPGLAALLVYAQVVTHTYIDFDDQHYTYENAMVVQGLTWEGVRWAFEDSHVANYHPLTWLSHMLDFDLFGNSPGAFALENAVFHALNAMLVARLMLMLFGSPGIAIALGVVFAIHPKLVEAVAWISQRKTLLATLFALASALLYLRASRNTTARARTVAFLGSLACYALSLLSKGMYVTMPAILPILEMLRADQARKTASTDSADDDSLRQLLSWSSIRRLAARMAPYIALALAFSWATYLAQAKDEAVQSFEHLSLGSRLATTLFGFKTYLLHFVYPEGLSVFYPRTEGWSLSQLALAGGTLIALTIGLLLVRRWCGMTPLLGWFLFLGMLVPVIGIVQVGDQASADRYMYGPILGLLIAAAGLTRGIFDHGPARNLRRVGIWALAAWLAFATITAFKQVQYWNNSYALAKASEESVGPHPQILGIQATILLRAREYQATADLCRKILAMDPTHLASIQNLAVAEFCLGNTDLAIKLCRYYADLRPGASVAYTNLAIFLKKSGRHAEALEAIAEARSRPPLNTSEATLLDRLERELQETKREVPEHLPPKPNS
ncbi:MAG: hypothetical protein IAE82_08295 [Opitutaceae bacterium]|nr:hypothetical protein [Opitutaceae bacterium]